MDDYLRQLTLDLVLINGYDHGPINRYNVAPSTRVEIIRQAGDGLYIDRVKWGWAPFWAKGKRPDPIRFCNLTQPLDFITERLERSAPRGNVMSKARSFS